MDYSVEPWAISSNGYTSDIGPVTSPTTYSSDASIWGDIISSIGQVATGIIGVVKGTPVSTTTSTGTTSTGTQVGNTVLQNSNNTMMLFILFIVVIFLLWKK